MRHAKKSGWRSDKATITGAVSAESGLAGGFYERLRLERGLPVILSFSVVNLFLGLKYGMTVLYIQPGKPNQNAYIEKFNKTYRDEILDLYLLRNLNKVRETIS